MASPFSPTHIQNRSLSPAPQRPLTQKLAYPRQRAIRACQLCRTRRIKCDNKKPSCSACEKSGAECITGDGEASTLDAGSQKVLQRIDDLERLIRSLKSPANAAVISSGASTAPKEKKKQMRVTIEDLLSWSIFQGHYDSHLNLKKLLRGDASINGITSPMSVDSFVTGGELEPYSSKRAVDNFFRYVHVKNPMLDEAKIRQSVQKMCLEGPMWDAESCLSLLVCALGSIASSFETSSDNYSDPQSIATAQSYFQAAQKRLGPILGTGGLLEAQCFFYSGVYLMSKLQPMRAWRLFNQALSCCQDFDCANPQYAGSPSSVRQGLPAEECVYWCCWKSEYELRTALFLPDFAFENLSYPLLFPTPPSSLQGEDATSWYFYLAEISLRRLQNRVRDEISDVLQNDLTLSGSELYNSTRAVEALADEWLQSLPPAMDLSTSQDEDDVLKFILRGHYMNLWEVIYWPWLQVFMDRRVHVPKVEVYVAKALQICVDRIHINKPGFRHRHHGTWLMLQSLTRSALALLAAAYCPEASVILPGGWKEAVFDVVDLLKFWQYEATDAANRLQILEELIAGIN